MRCFQNIIVGRQRQASVDGPNRLAFKQIIHLAHAVHISHIKIIGAVLALTHQVDIAVGAIGIPLDILKMPRTLQRHRNAFQPIGNFNRYRLQIKTAALLKVSKLGDLNTIQPNLPAQSPGADSWLLPVVFHKADVVPGRVNADGLQRFQVNLLRVARIGFEDHLELVELLQPIGVITIASVIRAD